MCSPVQTIYNVVANILLVNALLGSVSRALQHLVGRTVQVQPVLVRIVTKLPGVFKTAVARIFNNQVLTFSRNPISTDIVSGDALVFIWAFPI